MIFTQPFIWLLVLALIFIGLSIVWSNLFPETLFYSRKFLHITVISILAYAIQIINPIHLTNLVFFLCFVELILIFAVFKGFFQTEGRKSWGIIYFLPPTILLLTQFPHLTHEISISLLILALADGFSAVFGRVFQHHLFGIFPQINHNKSNHKRHWNTVHWGNDQKTFVGFFVFVLITFMVLFQFEISNNLLILSFISIFVGTVELLSGKGSDNFFIPLVSFFLILFFRNHEIHSTYIFMKHWPLIIASIIGVFAVYRMQWLTVSGIVFAIYLAIFVFTCEISIWPLIVFFVLGTLAGKMNKGVESDEKHERARDAFQVLANAGVVMLLLVLSGSGVVFQELNFLILVSIAVACSDTLSSEFGMRFGKKTFNVLTFKPLEKGVSGGVSLAGFLGAFFGACAIACFNLNGFWLILIWGILGSLTDSVFGMLFQAKYLNQNKITDLKTDNLVGGFAFVTNDLVNLMSNAVIVASAGFVESIF